MRRYILYLLVQSLIIQLFGQTQASFHPPVKIPMHLSGNFGELRPDHFHSGIDIKTQGTTGQLIYSIEEGYVSRIKVQANGYGNSIYITHPGGYTSVYGHLDRYREDIAAYVKKIQYHRRSYTVDIYLNPDQFLLDKGEFIAYSGNSGSSSGPHLHFEVRNAGNQHPTNVLKYNFDIRDDIAPRFYSVHLAPTDKDGHVNGTREKFFSPVVKDNGTYTVPYGTKIQAFGSLGISVEVFDYLNGASNRCGVYSIEMYVNDKLTYSHLMDEFSFSETRYVNAHINYEELIQSGTMMHRLYRLPNDRLSIYKTLDTNGLVVLNDNQETRIRIVARDAGGNSSELQFLVTGERLDVTPPLPSQDIVKHMYYQESNQFVNELINVDIPANALYQDLEFTFKTTSGPAGALTSFFHIATPEVPLHIPFTFSVKSPPLEPSLREKLLFITQNDEGEIEAAGGTYQNGVVVASSSNFGPYALMLDTVAPEIIPLNGTLKGNLTGKKFMKFNITDNLTSIEKYEGYIDNSWALFEYDLKNDILTYKFDNERIKQGSEHELELYVSDEKGNVSLFHTTFTW